MVASLEAICRQGLAIVIGDSEKGVDKEVIDFLRMPLYRPVRLFTVRATPRVPAEPQWEVCRIDAQGLKGRQAQTCKDRAMASKATWGLALFDPVKKNRYGNLTVSQGTLRNAIQLLLGKCLRIDTLTSQKSAPF